MKRGATRFRVYDTEHSLVNENLNVANSLSYIEALSELAATKRPFVSVTMVEATGSTPQDAGSKMLVDASGRVHGTVGGGKVEHRAIEFAKEMLSDVDRSREIVDWNLQRDIGMTCGGLVKLFFEVYNRDDWHIVIFGAGHVAQALGFRAADARLPRDVL